MVYQWLGVTLVERDRLDGLPMVRGDTGRKRQVGWSTNGWGVILVERDRLDGLPMVGVTLVVRDRLEGLPMVGVTLVERDRLDGLPMVGSDTGRKRQVGWSTNGWG